MNRPLDIRSGSNESFDDETGVLNKVIQKIERDGVEILLVRRTAKSASGRQNVGSNLIRIRIEGELRSGLYNLESSEEGRDVLRALVKLSQAKENRTRSLIDLFENELCSNEKGKYSSARLNIQKVNQALEGGIAKLRRKITGLFRRKKE